MQLFTGKTDETQIRMALRKEGKKRKGIGIRGEKRQWRKTLTKWWRSMLAAIVHVVEIRRKIL